MHKRCSKMLDENTQKFRSHANILKNTRESSCSLLHSLPDLCSHHRPLNILTNKCFSTGWHGLTLMQMSVPPRDTSLWPETTSVGLQLHVRTCHSDDACYRGHKSSKSNDSRIGLIDPQLVQRVQDLTQVLHRVQEQGRMLPQRSE